MRLCLDSFVPPLARITRGTAAWVRELGFRVIGVDLETPQTIDTARCRQVHDLLDGEGVSTGQVWSVGTPLVRPDPDEMRRNLTSLLDRIPCAAALGCRVLLVEAGGYHPTNPWFPHGRNHTDEALDVLIAQLRAVAPVATDHGIVVAPEMSLMTILCSPTRAREMLDGVGNEAIGINFDPANITEPRFLYRSGDLIREAFRLLGHRIVNAHAKEVIAHEVPLVVHLDETYAGNGVLDYPAFLDGLARLASWTCLVIEHLTDYGQVAAVKDFLERTAQEVGVTWE